MAQQRGKASVRRRRSYGKVKDVRGSEWDVLETRATKHGFDLYFGQRETFGGGLPKLIPTPDLVNFWASNAIKSHGFLYALPAGRTTLKRLRHSLGFNQKEAWEKFWKERLGDLATLKPQEFASKHGVTTDNTFDRRTKMLGTRSRPIGWWRKPATIKLLLSKLTLREIGEKLGIKTSQVARLRKQAQEA